MKKDMKEIKFEFEIFTQDLHFKEVLKSLGILDGSGVEDSVKPYYNTIVSYCLGAGVTDEKLLSESSIGLVARGISDIWNYGSGTGVLSEFFFQSLAQLVYKSRLK